ncbi:MAG: efflux RND transporter periplasmic adaptor subunit [Candidatus Methylomirabilales bacterium]
MRKQSLVFCMAMLLLGGCSNHEETSTVQGDRAVVRGVTIATIGVQPIAEVIEAVGTVRSTMRSVLSSKIVASVVAVSVEEGDRVKVGQVLVALDDRDVAAQLHRADAALREAWDALEESEQRIQAAEKAVEAAKAQQELALATFNRYKALLERRSVAPQEYDEVAARYKATAAEVERAQAVKASLLAKKRQVFARIEQAEAEVANAKVFVGYAKIRAPVDGIIVAKAVEVGNLAAPGVSLLTVEEERYRLEAAVGESAIRRIAVGQKATVAIDALGKELSGSVVEIVPTADPLSRTFTVKIDLSSAQGLRSGLYGKARFIVGQHKAMVVPREAIVKRGQLQGVFVLDQGNIAHLRLVKTGKAYGDRIEILSGLSEGERVVVEGIGKVSDGSRVERGG